jgi:hypothetical protein
MEMESFLDVLRNTGDYNISDEELDRLHLNPGPVTRRSAQSARHNGSTNKSVTVN